jgi:type I restriction enzyme R subunit
MSNSKFTESELENAIIELFQQEGYTHIYGDSIHRKYDEILLEDDIK